MNTRCTSAMLLKGHWNRTCHETHGGPFPWHKVQQWFMLHGAIFKWQLNWFGISGRGALHLQSRLSDNVAAAAGISGVVSIAFHSRHFEIVWIQVYVSDQSYHYTVPSCYFGHQKTFICLFLLSCVLHLFSPPSTSTHLPLPLLPVLLPPVPFTSTPSISPFSSVLAFLWFLYSPFSFSFLRFFHPGFYCVLSNSHYWTWWSWPTRLWWGRWGQQWWWLRLRGW